MTICYSLSSMRAKQREKLVGSIAKYIKSALPVGASIEEIADCFLDCMEGFLLCDEIIIEESA